MEGFHGDLDARLNWSVVILVEGPGRSGYAADSEGCMAWE
jgi:hypothetical protein